MSNASPSVTAPISGPQSAPVGQPPAPSASLVAKYRGATVEDLQVPPAISVPRSTSIAAALRVALDHDYSQLPLVSDKNRKLLGYVQKHRLEEQLKEGNSDKTVASIMTKFSSGPAASASSSAPAATYTVITPDTGLAELEVFLQSQPFAFITDPGRAFVLGVATQEDLSKYVSRRGLDGTRSGAATPTQTTTSAAAPRDNDEPMPSTAAAATSQSAPHTMSRREEEESRKDRTLAEFLQLLDGYDPLIPDQVTDFYLEKVGFECHDLRLKRLLSLAAEKFVSDIAADAFQYARIRTNAGPGGRPRGQVGAAGASGAAGAAGSNAQGARDRSRTVLTMDDLSAALGEYGINARRAEYFR
ncbi:transcription initiation factor IID, TAF10 subunit [Moesziomyces antarcticus]|uniref:Related to TAF10 - TFIID and SAGA subunit n=1 Tax=Pseudozyma antarctica TaxID=84753 RepID=A0A5C3FJY3_PSEA2|nr:transcription initiation factor IID, TAF10 subunit [Moesziomyces antarcticus]GAK63364.1 transcription initiation factor IID, TAF10 subunit [Moesziomyces antarcticus]SPO43947.1 related to TAF10 - TFIID and SAGA subunit [Moesziomyces antarcticus]